MFAKSGESGPPWGVPISLGSSYAQWYCVHRNERLTREILDLMRRVENIAQARYSGGLAALQDVIRAQVEQTRLRSELVTLGTEQHHLRTRLNASLARPAAAPPAEPDRLRPLPAPARLDYVTLAERVLARNPLLASDLSKIKAAKKAGEALCQVADLSTVWVIADVLEQDIGRVKSAARDWRVRLAPGWCRFRPSTSAYSFDSCRGTLRQSGGVHGSPQSKSETGAARRASRCA